MKQNIHFDFLESKKIDALWAKEAEARLNAFSSGRMKAIPAEQVFQSIQERNRTL